MSQGLELCSVYVALYDKCVCVKRCVSEAILSFDISSKADEVDDF